MLKGEVKVISRDAEIKSKGRLAARKGKLAPLLKEEKKIRELLKCQEWSIAVCSLLIE